MTKKVAILGFIVLTLGGCCTIHESASCKEARFAAGFQHLGAPAPRCADAVVVAADTLTPCDGVRPLHGYAMWRPAPFMCDFQMVWGCSVPNRPYIAVDVALPPTGHASDSALPEEVAHWVWARCYPAVKTEWFVKDPATGRTVQVRDPQFKAWYGLVASTARAACP